MTSCHWICYEHGLLCFLFCLYCCLSLVESFFRVWWSPYTNSKWTSSCLHSWLHRQVHTLRFLFHDWYQQICDKCVLLDETLNHCFTLSKNSVLKLASHYCSKVTCKGFVSFLYIKQFCKTFKAFMSILSFGSSIILVGVIWQDWQSIRPNRSFETKTTDFTRFSHQLLKWSLARMGSWDKIKPLVIRTWPKPEQKWYHHH